MSVDIETSIINKLQQISGLPAEVRRYRALAVAESIERPVLTPGEIEDLSDILDTPSMQRAYDLLKRSSPDKKI